jgi:hypothetical protein
METTAETTSYMIGGFVVFTVTMAIYLWSLVSRWKALKEEEKLLNELGAQNN